MAEERVLVAGVACFIGLTVLSIIISQLHRLVEMLEEKEIAPKAASPDKVPEKFPISLDQVAALYEPLVKQLPESFGLESLYGLSREKDYPHPHLTIRSFREAGILIAQGEGKYSWKSKL